MERNSAMATTDTSQREGLHPRRNRLAGRLLESRLLEAMFLINRVNVFIDGRLPSTKLKLNRGQSLFFEREICMKSSTREGVERFTKI